MTHNTNENQQSENLNAQSPVQARDAMRNSQESHTELETGSVRGNSQALKLFKHAAKSNGYELKHEGYVDDQLPTEKERNQTMTKIITSESPKFGDLNITDEFRRINVLNGNKTNGSNAFFFNFEKWEEKGTALYAEFDPEWKNGTGYFDNIAKIQTHKEDGLMIGQTIFSYDPVTRRRLAIIVGRHGNVVIFDRYTDGEAGTIVHNAERPYSLLLSHTDLGYDDVSNACSQPYFNKTKTAFIEGVIGKFEEIRNFVLARV